MVKSAHKEKRNQYHERCRMQLKAQISVTILFSLQSQINTKSAKENVSLKKIEQNKINILDFILYIQQFDFLKSILQ